MQNVAVERRSVIRFGVFEADLDARELRKQGVKIKLQEQPFQILSMLLERPGQVVTREELQKRIWNDDTFVDFDRGLNKAVNRLRETLDDSAESPRFIETLPKRGYRFVASVERTGNAAGESSTAAATTPKIDRATQQSSRGRSAQKAPWIVAVAFLSTTVLFATLYFGSGPRIESSPIIRSSILPPHDLSFFPSHFAVSPNGTRLAFVATDSNGSRTLWVRDLSTRAARRLEGTDDATFPFWSADNRQIGFFAQRKLKAIDLGGGAVRVVADAPSGHGGTWNADDVIVFAPSVAGTLYRVAAAGGVVAPVTSIRATASGQSHCWPSFLPDDRHFLFYVFRSTADDALPNGTYIGTIDSNDAVRLSPEVVGNAMFSSGYLVYVRERSLVRQPFDPVRFRLTGTFVPIVEQELDADPTYALSAFSVSRSGVIVIQSTADASTRLTWFDRSGHDLGPLADGDYKKDPSLSPDGRFLAVASDDARNQKYYIRVNDLTRGLSVRLTDGGKEDRPVWSRDGKDITYASNDGKAFFLSHVAADGSGAPAVLLKGGFMYPRDWSPDGHLVFNTLEKGLPFLSVYSLTSGSVSPLGPGAEAQVSPDGRWIAYIGHGGVAGGGSIVLQPFPGPGRRIQISGIGGAQPRWSRDGRQLFYVAPDKALMTVDFDPIAQAASAPRILFSTRIVAANLVSFQYDVAPDGRFLINSLSSDSRWPLTLITGWNTTDRR